MKYNDVIEIIEQIAPLSGASEWDNSGIQLAATKKQVQHIAVMLDPALETIQKALALGADFILTHHPFYFKPQALNMLDASHEITRLLLSNDVWLYAAHTSLDANPEGPASWLAEELYLENWQVLEQSYATPHLGYYILLLQQIRPEFVRRLARRCELQVFSAQTGDCLYINCTADAWPIVEDMLLQSYPDALILPAQTPASSNPLGLGLIGTLPEEIPYSLFATRLSAITGLDCWTVCGSAPEFVHQVAYCTGSGSSLAANAFALGADVFITGDVKYHAATVSSGRIIDVGHFSLEEEMMRRTTALLQESVPALTVSFIPSRDPFSVEYAEK